MSDDISESGPHESAPDRPPIARGGRRLPPPVFPPGSTGAAAPRFDTGDASASSMGFISPDDPMPGRLEPGYISPDAAIPRRQPHAAADAEDEDDADEGVVTGMGHDAHMELRELTLGFDPYVLEVVHTVTKLAEALTRKGEAGLKATPYMTRFEATLRSYCVGYLARRRAEDKEG